MRTLCQLAAIQFVKIESFNNDNYLKTEDLYKGKDPETIQNVIRILLDLALLDQVLLNNTLYYKYNHVTDASPKAFNVEPEVIKFKRAQLTNAESLLRQAKLMESCKSSGEEVKLIELIDKWESATRQVLKELFNHQIRGGGSMKKFVKQLGLDFDTLGFSEDEEDEEMSEQENTYGYSQYDEKENQQLAYDDDNDQKRIKYED